MDAEPAAITHVRLFEAAEGVAAVVHDAVCRAGGGWISSQEALSARALRVRLAGFTPMELEEATRFLVRLGIIEVR